jgi:hypothetical protein
VFLGPLPGQPLPVRWTQTSQTHINDGIMAFAKSWGSQACSAMFFVCSWDSVRSQTPLYYLLRFRSLWRMLPKS